MSALPRSTRATAAMALAVTTAGVTVLAHHHRHSAASSATLAEVVPLPPRASRSHEREPLPRVVPVTKPRRRQQPRLTVVRDVSLGYLDTTAYCATGNRTASGSWPQVGDVAVLDRSIRFGTRLRIDGNVYTVTDWIGHGSDVDLYFGGGADCERRALAYGRRRLRVVEVGR